MLGKTNACSLHSDVAQSERATREYLAFIMQNLKFLDNVRNGSKLKEAARSMNQQKEPFTPKQKSFVDNIYEKIMEGYGLPSYKGLNRRYNKFTIRNGSR